MWTLLFGVFTKIQTTSMFDSVSRGSDEHTKNTWMSMEGKWCPLDSLHLVDTCLLFITFLPLAPALSSVCVCLSLQYFTNANLISLLPSTRALTTLERDGLGIWMNVYVYWLQVIMHTLTGDPSTENPSLRTLGHPTHFNHSCSFDSPSQNVTTSQNYNPSTMVLVSLPISIVMVIWCFYVVLGYRFRYQMTPWFQVT